MRQFLAKTFKGTRLGRIKAIASPSPLSNPRYLVGPQRRPSLPSPSPAQLPLPFNWAKKCYSTHNISDDLIGKLSEKLTREGGAYMKLHDVRAPPPSPILPMSLPPCGKTELHTLDDLNDIKEYNLYHLKHQHDEHLRFIDILIVHQHNLTIVQHKPMQVDLAKLENFILAHKAPPYTSHKILRSSPQNTGVS